MYSFKSFSLNVFKSTIKIAVGIMKLKHKMFIILKSLKFFILQKILFYQ